MFKALTFNNVLSQEETNIVLNYAKASNVWQSGGNDFWANRVQDVQLIATIDPKVANIMTSLKEKIKNIIMKNMSSDIEVFSDTFQLIRWFEGSFQPPHADDMTNIKSEGLEYFAHRKFGSIVYLNDDFEGGETYYPNYNKVIKPVSGMLAIHPGDPDHLHGVTMVNKNIRYTIASFWAYEKKFLNE